MNRLSTDPHYRETIAQAFRVLPRNLRRRLEHTQFLCGVDPVFAGLHEYTGTIDDRPYKDTAHCAWPIHIIGPADRRTSTVVLPKRVSVSNVVHELGHVLDWQLGRSHMATPVSEYAATDRNEAFAEALVAQLFVYGDQDAWWSDGATRALWMQL
jgi:hypothetical protein